MRQAAKLLALFAATVGVIPTVQSPGLGRAPSAPQIPEFFAIGATSRFSVDPDPWELATPSIASPVGGPLPLAGMEPLLPLKAIPHQTLAQADSREVEGMRLFNQGMELFNRSRFQEAIAAWEAALEIAREIGHRQGEGAVLGSLGIAYGSLENYPQAIHFSLQWLDIAREIGDRQGEGGALGNLGIAYSALGDYQQAITFFQQSLDIAQEIGDRQGEGAALGNLGLAYSAL
ncbi:MAG: tetratricopeptide repeat protein, partial [Cyanobacteria bacterium]|nr:tetratricopeptide repeat protein [Cyanobacteriota bacterium]